MDKLIINKKKHPLPLQVNIKKYEKNTYIPPKHLDYEYWLEKLSIKKTHMQPLSHHITSISSKFSAYENRLDKISIDIISKFEIEMEEKRRDTQYKYW